jgi:hypothetical protein
VSFVIVSLAAAAILLVGAAYFDQVVRTLHSRHPEIWREVGCPPGFLWWPSSTSWWSHSDARQRLVTQISFRTPAWARSDDSLLHAIRFYRLAWLSFIVVGLLGCFAV